MALWPFGTKEKATLSAEQRTAFDQLRSERTAAFDKLVRANYAIIVELATLQNETDPARRLELLARTREAFASYTQRGSSLDEFASNLTTQQRIQVDAMLLDYRQARADELRKQARTTLRQVSEKIGDPELRASFLALPTVQKVLVGADIKTSSS